MRGAWLLCLLALACKPAPKTGSVPPAPKGEPAPTAAVDAGATAARPDGGAVGDAGAGDGVSHVRPAPQPGRVSAGDGGTLTLSGHREAILAVAFSPDGKRVATGGLDRSVRVWDVERGAELFAAGGSEEAITALAFDARSALLAAGNRAFQVQLLQAADGKLVHLQPHPDPVSDVAFSPDGKWLAVAGVGGNADVYPMDRAGKSTCQTRGRTIAFTDHGQYLVTAVPAGALIVTTFPGCKKKKETSTSPHLPFAAASAKASLVASRNGAEPFVLLWDTLSGRMLGKLDRQQGGSPRCSCRPTAGARWSPRRTGRCACTMSASAR